MASEAQLRSKHLQNMRWNAKAIRDLAKNPLVSQRLRNELITVSLRIHDEVDRLLIPPPLPVMTEPMAEGPVQIQFFQTEAM